MADKMTMLLFFEEAFNRTSVVFELLDFLREEAILAQPQIDQLMTSPSKFRDLTELMSRLRNDGRVQMVDYEWQILPYRRLRMFVVTKQNAREFLYAEE